MSKHIYSFQGLFAQGCLLQSYISSCFQYFCSSPTWLQTAVNKEEEGGRGQGPGEPQRPESSVPCLRTRHTTVNSDKKNSPFRLWRGGLCGMPSSQRESHGCPNPCGEDAACPRRAISHTGLSGQAGCAVCYIAD